MTISVQRLSLALLGTVASVGVMASAALAGPLPKDRRPIGEIVSECKPQTEPLGDQYSTLAEIIEAIGAGAVDDDDDDATPVGSENAVGGNRC